MSRIGKYPVPVPSEVTIVLGDGEITAHGRQGTLSIRLRSEIAVFMKDSSVWVSPRADNKFARAMWGTTRAKIRNMVVGVDQGFSKRLDIVGVGYRAAVHENILTMALGFSHEIVYPIPECVTIRCDSPITMTITGASKERVGQVAAEIRSYRPPEPYKGKGVQYADEQIFRKEGKKK
ncbi:LSU ribosomal protein L6p (L9e) [invertebrate metagenome]|uniref:LSU ribosomal protein L6p (L9e) n=1 Tax=invertebrate metagenome TaxID=1711999 RepID=A0A484H4B0_9ZZZZ